MSNIQLKLSENKKIKYLEQKVVGRIGEKNLTTIDVYLQKADFKTPYVIPTDATVKFIAETNTNNYTDGYASIVDGEKGFIQYTFTEDNFSDSSGKGKRPFKAAYFELETSDGNRVTFQDFEVYVLPRADISADQATYYVSSLEKILSTFQVTFDQFIIDNTVTYDEFYEKYNNLIRRINESDSKADDVVSKVNAALIEFETGDFFNKQESSANVIDQIGGAESTILKKELLVNGTEGMSSRFVKDLPYTNIILNGDFKNGITNWSYHQPAGNLSEFVDDVVHAKSNNGTVTGVFQPSDQRLKYGYSTKANEKFFFYALAKGTGTIQLGFDKKRGSATLTQNYTWVGVESTGTTDNEVMTFYTTGEMWIKAIVVSKTEIMNIESFYPAAEDVGVVHGQPNLRNGTSSTLSEVTFIQTQYKETNLVVSNLFKPNDLVTYAVQIDNTAGTADVFAQLAFKKSDNTYVSFNGSSVLKGSIGRSMVQVTVLEEYTNIYVKPLVKSNSTISTTVRYGEEKLIKGSLEAMDEWTPSQADSGLTPINGGMVPFNEKDYEDLLSDDGIVRAETKIVGRGAEIEFKFDVIGTLEKKYPYLFEGLSSMAEKIGAVNKILKSMSLVSTFRGGGLNSSSGASLNFARWNILRNKANSTTALDYSTVNLTADFKNYEISLNNMLALNIRDEGNTVLYLASKKNGNSDNGAISDGVTPAWIEVKDIRLTVELEVNGRTIIEELIAANHRENLATQDEAEEGLNESKTMTPVRVFQAIAKWIANKFVSVAGNETILGIKNFTGGLLVSDKRVLTVDDILQTSGTIPLINGNTGVLKYTKQLKNVTLTFNGLNGKYGGTPSGSTLANLPADLRPANYFEELVGSTDRGAVNTAALSFATTGEINWQRNSSTASDYSFEVTYQTI